MRTLRSCALVVALASCRAGTPEPGAEIGARPPGEATDPSRDKTRPAREFYRNIKLFTRDDVSAEFFDSLMEGISRDLGVSCLHCHQEGALDVADLGPRKVLAREAIPLMWRIVSEINGTHFPGQGGPVRCWTCHRGSPAPERVAPPEHRSAGGRVPPLPTNVGSNLQILKGLSRSELRREMRSIAGALGLRCVDCHVAGDWASDDKPRKRAARQMLAMTDSIERAYFEPGRGPTCWTCHRGSTAVPSMPE